MLMEPRAGTLAVRSWDCYNSPVRWEWRPRTSVARGRAWRINGLQGRLLRCCQHRASLDVRLASLGAPAVRFGYLETPMVARLAFWAVLLTGGIVLLCSPTRPICAGVSFMLMFAAAMIWQAAEREGR